MIRVSDYENFKRRTSPVSLFNDTIIPDSRCRRLLLPYSRPTREASCRRILNSGCDPNSSGAYNRTEQSAAADLHYSAIDRGAPRFDDNWDVLFPGCGRGGAVDGVPIENR